MAEKRVSKLKMKLKIKTNQSQNFIEILTQVFCTFGPNLVILAWTGDELSCRQAQNGVTFDLEVKFDLEGQGQSLPKTIGMLTKVFYTYGPNLVFLAWRGDELSRGQASDYRTDGRTDTLTDAGNDNTRRPKLASGKNHLSKYRDCHYKDKTVMRPSYLYNGSPYIDKMVSCQDTRTPHTPTHTLNTHPSTPSPTG